MTPAVSHQSQSSGVVSGTGQPQLSQFCHLKAFHRSRRRLVQKSDGSDGSLFCQRDDVGSTSKEVVQLLR